MKYLHTKLLIIHKVFHGPGNMSAGLGNGTWSFMFLRNFLCASLTPVDVLFDQLLLYLFSVVGQHARYSLPEVPTWKLYGLRVSSE